MNDEVSSDISLKAIQLFEGGVKVWQIQKILVKIFPRENEVNINNQVKKTIEMYTSPHYKKPFLMLVVLDGI